MEAARQVVDGDGRINEQTCAIDEACLKLLALEQPVALDLRRIVGYARAVINFERLGDEAVTIAEAVLSGAGLPGSPDSALRTLAEHAQHPVAGFLDEVNEFHVLGGQILVFEQQARHGLYHIGGKLCGHS